MRHKFGFHCNRTGDDVMAAIKRIKPEVIKTMDPNVGFWSRVRAIHPDVYLIGRIVVGPSEQDMLFMNPTETGRKFAERILGQEASKTTFEGKPLFDAWESYNEVLPGHDSAERKRQYNEFQVAFYQPIKDAGMEPIAMNFATGNMLGEDFLTYFRESLDLYDMLGFHEYDWPTMWRLHEENIREKNEGGMWLTLRYRRIMQEVRKVYGNKHTVIISECGMTQGVIGRDDVGWRHEPAVTEDDYWKSLLWYNQELLKDDYVQGTCLFVVGATGGWPKWESFEHLGGIIDRLKAYQDEPEDAPPPPPPPPNGDIVNPPEQARTLPAVLLQEAESRQVIQFNREAALQKRIFADGFVPNSPEFEVEHGGVRYLAQRAEHLASGEVRVYHVKWGDWGNVTFVVRSSGDRGLQMA